MSDEINKQLLKAVVSNNIGQVKSLLASGANINYKDPVLKETSLIKAAEDGKINMINLLLEKGADINVQTLTGVTPLFNAVFNEYSSDEAVRLLLKAGANPNISTKYGETPLHIAIPRENLKVIKYLIQAGADPTIVDGDGKDAFDLAKDPFIKKYIQKIYKEYQESKMKIIKRGQNLMLSLYQNKRLPADVLRTIGEMNTKGVGKAVNVVEDIYTKRYQKEQEAKNTMPGLEPIPNIQSQPNIGYSSTNREEPLNLSQVPLSKLAGKTLRVKNGKFSMKKGGKHRVLKTRKSNKTRKHK